MKIGAIIQARTGSTRFPNKILKKILDKPALIRVLERVKKIKILDEIVVATTPLKKDDTIVKIVRGYDKSIKIFRGSEMDVLDRYYQATLKFNLNIIIRITSDCPLIDPQISDLVVRKFLDDKYDYCSNCLFRTFPLGLDTEVFSFRTLGRAWQDTTSNHDREHVTPYIRRHPDKFRIFNLKNSKNLSYLRWTLDYPEDLKFISQVYQELYPKKK